MTGNKIVRKSSSFRIVITVPDFCWLPPSTPPSVLPIPFPLFADLGCDKTVAKDVHLDRKPDFVFNASKTDKTYCDEIVLPFKITAFKEYNGTSYYYDDLGNLIHRELADGEVQNYFYDLHDQLVKAEVFKKDGSKETWAYSYDALGRKIGKGRLNS